MVEEAGTTATEDRSVAQLVQDGSEQVSRLVRDEMRLAVAEMRQKGKRFGLGAGLGGVAGMMAFFGVATLVATVVLALALVLPGWAAALIVAGVLLFVAGILGLASRSQVKKAVPPMPREASEGVQKDINVVKESARR